ncbi:MAG: cupin domain-containing protein [Methylibium sp.]|nr:cupin domain-containing protein [Methylibium sp.]
MQARDVIRQLNLAPHPEGGWCHETWRAPAPDGRRAAGTAMRPTLRPGGRA